MSRLNKNKLQQKKKKRVFIISSSVIIAVLILSIIIFPKISNCVSISKTNWTVLSNSNDIDDMEYVISEQPKKAPEKIDLDGYLFLGDSYTVLLKDTIKKHNENAIIKAVEGVQPDYWIDNFNDLPNDEDVKGVVLLIGVNGATYSNNVSNKEKLISSLVEKYKNKTIYVQEVFPVGKKFSNANPKSFNKAIKNHNKETEKYCDNYDNVYYINATNNLITKDGYLKFTRDGLHIAGNKQETFYENIVSAINKSN
ncbi:hypothetical protein [Terrisporobacter glycolicus]|uniref:SGNH hydrolase-type esterase domain-containing protein n=1 Tax=Terrisporobacter glycolicus ATCC 14880 = DSM 1288 TaxID=1121315 RepID=A0ABZ2ESF0_9FIRM|nr:hypothetical protein [Terrisporobacter glycolicus]